MDQTTLLFFGKSGGSSPAVLDTLNVTVNGTYTPPSGTDGYNEVNVNVTPALETLSATSNGSYSPSAGKDGFSSVTVAVVPELETKSITTNGTYTPSTGKDGFSSVTVNVPSSQVPFTPSSGTCKGLFACSDQDNTYSDAQKYALDNLQNKTFTNPDDCSYMFSSFKGDAGDVTIVSDSVNGEYMFYRSNLTGVPNLNNCFFIDVSSLSSYSSGLIPLNVKMDTNNFVSLRNSFSNTGNLITVAPTISLKNGNVLKLSNIGINSMFGNCKYVRNFDNVFSQDIEFDFTNQPDCSIYQVFMLARSMLSIPSWYYKVVKDCFDTARTLSTSNYNWYSGDFRDCCCCANFVDIPVVPVDFTGNAFQNGSFTKLSSCTHFTFETNNGAPIVVNWKNQVIDFSYYHGRADSYQGPNYYCPDLFTEETRIYNNSDYARLKNNPYRWTTEWEYCRYDHSSAVETINSLPDCSGSGSVNTIKFEGAAGTNTDGGAISNLTSAEIAVAAAKGWTVTIQ